MDHASGDPQIHFIEMSDRVRLGAALPQFSSDLWSEMVHPTANGLIGDNNSTLREQIRDVAQAQGEAKVEPDRLPNDVGREAVTVVADLSMDFANQTRDKPQVGRGVTTPS